MTVRCLHASLPGPLRVGWCFRSSASSLNLTPRRRPSTCLLFRLALAVAPSAKAAAKATQEQLGPRTKIRIAQNKKVGLVSGVERTSVSRDHETLFIFLRSESYPRRPAALQCGFFRSNVALLREPRATSKSLCAKRFPSPNATTWCELQASNNTHARKHSAKVHRLFYAVARHAGRISCKPAWHMHWSGALALYHLVLQYDKQSRCPTSSWLFPILSPDAFALPQKDDVGAALPVLRGGEDAPRSEWPDKVQHAPAGQGRVGSPPRGGAGSPQPPAAENHPLHAPKGTDSESPAVTARSR